MPVRSPARLLDRSVQRWSERITLRSQPIGRPAISDRSSLGMKAYDAPATCIQPLRFARHPAEHAAAEELYIGNSSISAKFQPRPRALASGIELRGAAKTSIFGCSGGTNPAIRYAARMDELLVTFEVGGGSTQIQCLARVQLCRERSPNHVSQRLTEEIAWWHLLMAVQGSHPVQIA